MSTVPPQQGQASRPTLSSSEASVISGLSRSHIQYLVRSGQIEGIKPGGRDWLIYEDSLKAFLAQSRSPGRKGPRGPRKKREVRQTEQGERILLSTAEAHQLYGYRQDSLLRLRRAGRIEGEKVGGQWFIYEDSLRAYKQSRHPTRIEPTESSPASLGK